MDCSRNDQKLLRSVCFFAKKSHLNDHILLLQEVCCRNIWIQSYLELIQKKLFESWYQGSQHLGKKNKKTCLFGIPQWRMEPQWLWWQLANSHLSIEAPKAFRYWVGHGSHQKKWLNPIILSPRNPGWLGTRVLVPSRKLRESLGFFHISHPKTNKNPNGKIKKISTPKTRVAICFTEKSLAKDQLVPNVRAIHGFGQPMICYNSVDQVLLGATPGIFHPQTVIGKMVAPAPWDGGPL